MADQITQVVQNADGSWTFSFTFDNGAGVMTNTTIPVPPGVLSAADAKVAALATAKSTKASWMQGLQNQSVIGAVSL